jgi:hypothetical protein
MPDALAINKALVIRIATPPRYNQVGKLPTILAYCEIGIAIKRKTQNNQFVDAFLKRFFFLSINELNESCVLLLYYIEACCMNVTQFKKPSGSMTTQAIDNDPEPKSGLVWLASYPKSGNTWTRALLSNLAAIMAGERDELDVNSINRFSLGENFIELYKERLGFKPTKKHHKEVAALRHEVQQWIADQFEGLVFVKTHNGLVIDHGRSIINFAVTSGAIYIVRNPLDVAISLAHHMGKTVDQAIETMAQPDTETPINDKRVYEIWGSWSQNVESWTRKPQPAIYVMRYEDMLSDPQEIFGGLARHLLLNPTPAQLTLAIERSSFAKLRSQEEQKGFKEKSEKAERFFREGRAGQWKEILSPKQIERIVNDHGKQMARFSYLPLA